MPSARLDPDILAKTGLKKVLNKESVIGESLLGVEFQGKAENQRRT